MNEANNYWHQLQALKETNSEDIQSLYAVFEDLIYKVTDAVNITFSTFYVRMSYVFHSYPVPGNIQWQLYRLRRLNLEKNIAEDKKEVPSDDIHKYHNATASLVSVLFKEKIPSESVFTDELPKIFENNNLKFYPSLRAVVQHVDYTKKILHAVSEKLPGEAITIETDAPELYPELFIPNDWLGLPYTISLIQSKVQDNGHFMPELIILEPDYLVDVTTVSEISADAENIGFHLLTKKFITQAVTSSLLEGHAANLFLDNLVKNPDAGFREIFTELFHTYPLVLAKYDDDKLKELYENCKLHYSTLKWVTQKEFPKYNIFSDGIFVEPSFINPVIGIQGRLDILFRGDNNNQSIIELKSGKPFMENKYGLSRSHYYQTLLYDMLVKAVSRHDATTSCFILYSKLGEQGLRYAPPVKSMQNEALRVRNQIFALEKQISVNGNLENIISDLSLDDKSLKGFLYSNWKYFKNVLNNADDISKTYFYACVAFISREHLTAKTGVDVSDRLTGQSAVWLETTTRKEDNFSIFKGLTIREVKLSQEEPLVILYKSELTNKLANFRAGDIVILYPGESQTPARNQIFKCTIIELDGDKIVLRLRATQLNSTVFFDHKVWNIEPDMLESSFNGLYRGVFDFLSSSEDKRHKILGLSPPRCSDKMYDPPPYLIDSQRKIYQKALQAEDYFLIWGPPGTGKTSRLVKALTEYYYTSQTKPILIAAYTNRAADEICEAIESINIEIKNHYVRVGARYSTSPAYRQNLLENKLKTCTQRTEVLKVLKDQLIVVGTLASISGKPELFDYYDFACGIVDEASQVLEPTMAGLMSKLPKTILIGDHKQLPSIVTQPEKLSRIEDLRLTSAGFDTLADSLFERMFNRCKEMDWNSAYGMLTHQGRMHPEIASIPNEQFYDGNLHSISSDTSYDLLEKMRTKPGTGMDLYFKNRISFIDCPIATDEIHLKTNTVEAREVISVIDYLNQNMPPGSKYDIGIITPFRAQIALIKNLLEVQKIDSSNITIDTVERYQGGARDIILISLCANKKSSLRSITSVNKEGIDRKLNVALTRARQQVIIFGNKAILMADPTYARLMELYETKEYR
ncbi:AAA domain-containing protein [Saprospiraceae bacterium]